MRIQLRLGISFIAAFAVAGGTAFASAPLHTQGSKAAAAKGIAVAFPWVSNNGHKEAFQTAMDAAGEVGQRAGYASTSSDISSKAWAELKLPTPTFGAPPTVGQLVKFGKKMNANVVLYGSVEWHTRSIWVNLGPKTISTATVVAKVLDVRTGKVIYKQKGSGRSDEKANGLKIAGAILITPLVTAVSGGPATPQEQRAVQIAMAKSYRKWVSSKTK